MAARTLYLIRHGQYNPEHQKEPLGNDLTPTGVIQARHTAERMAAVPLTAIHTSSLLRAVQTARYITEAHPDLPLQESELLWEITPPLPYLAMKYIKGISSEEIARDRRQAEKAFERYFRPAGEQNEFEAVICHGNLIRYFVCRVLQVSPLIWMNFEIYNCSISMVEIDPMGNTILLSYNESGHLPEEFKTQNLTDMGIGKKGTSFGKQSSPSTYQTGQDRVSDL